MRGRTNPSRTSTGRTTWSSGIWDLSFGRGKRLGNTMPRAADFLLGGWQLNAVVQRQSGLPLGFGDVWTLFTGNPNDLVLPKNQRSPDH
jgi:hypothetical protein